MTPVRLGVVNTTGLPHPWHAAAADLGRGQVEVVDLDVSQGPAHLVSTSRGTLDGLVVHGHAVECSRLSDQVAPRVFYRVSLPGDPLLPPSPLPPGLGYRGTSRIEGEAYGALVCTRHVIQAWSEEAEDLVPPPTHGPRAQRAGQAPAPWDSSIVARHGIPVSLDEGGVLADVIGAHLGQVPLYAAPGFPFCVPRAPRVYGTGQGLLCAPLVPGDTWRVLRLPDLLACLGADPAARVTWDQVSSLVPRAVAGAICRSLVARGS